MKCPYQCIKKLKAALVRARTERFPNLGYPLTAKIASVGFANETHTSLRAVLCKEIYFTP
jgi:hypothetical protein